MSMESREFIFSPGEAVLLRDAVSMNGNLPPIIESALMKSGSRLIVMLDLETVEKFREHLTVQLARIGFDGDYSLTNEGAILEDLIDKLHFRE